MHFLMVRVPQRILSGPFRGQLIGPTYDGIDVAIAVSRTCRSESPPHGQTIRRQVNWRRHEVEFGMFSRQELWSDDKRDAETTIGKLSWEKWAREHKVVQTD